jgi:streptogramin lyase
LSDADVDTGREGRAWQGLAIAAVAGRLGPAGGAAATGRLQRGECPHRPLTHEILSDLLPVTGL